MIFRSINRFEKEIIYVRMFAMSADKSTLDENFIKLFTHHEIRILEHECHTAIILFIAY